MYISRSRKYRWYRCRYVSTRSATVIAKSNLEVLVLLRDDLNELMKSGDLNPECIQALQKVAQQRKIQNTKQLKVKAKLARVLQKCAPFAYIIPILYCD